MEFEISERAAYHQQKHHKITPNIFNGNMKYNCVRSTMVVAKIIIHFGDFIEAKPFILENSNENANQRHHVTMHIKYIYHCALRYQVLII